MQTWENISTAQEMVVWLCPHNYLFIPVFKLMQGFKVGRNFVQVDCECKSREFSKWKCPFL